jgi:hypothetical protein
VRILTVVHNSPSNFLRSRDLWQRITNNNVPKQQHRLGDGTFVEYPLRLMATQAVDSADSRAIQFCDVLAGIGARYFDPRTAGNDLEFMDRLVEAGLKHISYNGILPAPVFPDRIPPKRLSGPSSGASSWSPPRVCRRRPPAR